MSEWCLSQATKSPLHRERESFNTFRVCSSIKNIIHGDTMNGEWRVKNDGSYKIIIT